MKWLKKIFGVHKHNYTIPETIQGIMFFKCDYPGCSHYDTSPEQDEKDKRDFGEFERKVNELK